MPSNLTDRPEAPPATGAAEEVDFREHVVALAAWWREIVLLAVLAVAAGIGFAVIVEPTWRAVAAVAIVPTKTRANFDKEFSIRTVPDSGIGSAPRQEALRGLVLGGSVARGVIDALGDQLDENERNPAWLIDRVVTVASERHSLRESELILIAAETDSPEKAATIANAWAAAHVREVNSLYARAPDETVALMQKKVAEAQGAYDDAQRKAEAFAATAR